MTMFKSWQARTFLLIALVGAFKIFYNATLPLHFDEAYYWMMSRHLQASYFDIPPMLAYLIALTGWLGEAEWMIRLVSVFCGMGAAVFVFLLARDIYDEKTGFWTIVFLLALPLVQTGFTIVTTDAPLVLFWSAAAYFGYRALFKGSWNDWLGFGLLLGLALLSKYTAVLLGGAAAIYVLLWRRDLLLSPKPWIAAIVALIVFSPVLYWNRQLDWAALIFRYEYGSGSNNAIALRYAGEYLAGAIGIFTPVLLVWFFALLFKRRGTWRNEERYLLTVTLTMLVFFGYKGLTHGMAPNWYAPSVLTALPLMIHAFLSGGYKKTAIAALATALLLTLLITFPNAFLLKGNANLYSRVMGYHEAVAAYEKHLTPESNLCADYYSSASLINYLLPDYRDRVLLLNKRISDYDFWPQPGYAGKTCIFLADKDFTRSGSPFCEELTLLEKYVYEESRYVKRTWFIYECAGVKPKDPRTVPGHQDQ